MKKHFFLLVIVVLMLSVSAKLYSQPTNCPSKGFIGCWKTLYQRCFDTSSRGPHIMRIRNAEPGYLQGSWGSPNTMSRYSLYGKLTGNTWEGYWWVISVPVSSTGEPSVVNTGTFKFIVSGTGNNFTGVWNTIRGDCDPAAPTSRNLSWSGTKTSCNCSD